MESMKENDQMTCLQRCRRYYKWPRCLLIKMPIWRAYNVYTKMIHTKSRVQSGKEHIERLLILGEPFIWKQYKTEIALKVLLLCRSIHFFWIAPRGSLKWSCPVDRIYEWNSYIRSVAKDAGKWPVLYTASERSWLLLYKSQIKLKITIHTIPVSY